MAWLYLSRKLTSALLGWGCIADVLQHTVPQAYAAAHNDLSLSLSGRGREELSCDVRCDSPWDLARRCCWRRPSLMRTSRWWRRHHGWSRIALAIRRRRAPA